jgi:hypothetical protein
MRRCISHVIRVKKARNCSRQQTRASFAHSMLPGSSVCLRLCRQDNCNLTLAAAAKYASCCKAPNYSSVCWCFAELSRDRIVSRLKSRFIFDPVSTTKKLIAGLTTSSLLTPLANRNLRPFFCSSAKLLTATISLVMSVRPSLFLYIRMEQLGSHFAQFHQI